MVSVDERGGIFLWEYSAKHFSGFGWFAPSTKYKLQLDGVGRAGEAKQGDDGAPPLRLLAAQQTASGDEIILVVDGAKAGADTDEAGTSPHHSFPRLLA